LAEKYKQIGNAVPVGLAEAVGKSILAVAEGSYIVNTKRMRVREEGGNYERYAESN
jgi:DNA (cytosine-5)-methyltransferase 1